MSPSKSSALSNPRDFQATVLEVYREVARPERIDSLMINVGLRCDLACAHCHHSCSPTRTEVMSRETMLDALALAGVIRPQIVDITGGEPALFEHLRELISLTRAAGMAVRVRTNLVALATPEGAELPGFFAENSVQLLASLPGVSAPEVGAQRGSGDVWRTSVDVLRTLAATGYGSGEGPVLDLAYNAPLGQAAQDPSALEPRFRGELELLGIRFDSLLILPNVPVGRYRQLLKHRDTYSDYVEQLRSDFNPGVLRALSCRHGLEVAWDGTLWDCDFNLGAGLRPVAGPLTVAEALGDPAALGERRIGFGAHCFACTAGAGAG